MKVGIARPEAIFGSTEQENLELGALANEIAERIQAAHDWQRVKRTQAYTGDGTTTAFELPTDYSRMALEDTSDPNSFLIRSSSCIGISYVTNGEYLDLTVRGFSTATLAWTLMEGRMQFYPAPSPGEVIKWQYISTLYARSSGSSVSDFFPLDLPFDFTDSDEYGTRKAAFTDDADFFQLDERLLKLGMIWQWKHDKGLPYAEDMLTYEQHLAQRVMRDPGQRGIRIGRPRMPRGDIALPWTIPA